jgi:hypothetical protein
LHRVTPIKRKCRGNEKASAHTKQNTVNKQTVEQNAEGTEQSIEQPTKASEQHVTTAEHDVETEDTQNVDMVHNVVDVKHNVATMEHEKATPTLSPRQHFKAEGELISRQRSSDSLTLSSSVSDSEVTSSEGVSSSGNQASTKKKSGVGAGKKSKKQGKKSKKGQKQSKSQPTAQQAKERSEKSMRRRAHIMQRIRNDSWNTSSDEDNSLTPLTESISTDTAFLEEGSSEVIEVDIKEVQADLQRRILSKKPPAPFDTPATDPIYHEVSRFQLCGHQTSTLS